MQCGLLGEKLGHSYSPLIHNALADYSYKLFETEKHNLENFLKTGTFSGVNVTIPYKKAVIPYLSELSPAARKLGSVNTIVRRDNGQLVGHNTDYFGFKTMVERCGVSPAGKKALVLGSGGASNTVVAVLEEMGAQVVVISRTGANNYDNLHLHQDAAILVNTTPVGMYPNVGIAPVSLSLFPHLEYVLDIIFNPARTQLLLDAEKLGVPTMNGLLMLVAQAKESAEWFTGKAIDDSQIDAIYRKLKADTENIFLIGMPGCGKSTIGMLLSQALNRPFVDADAKIAEAAEMDIPSIFAKFGESRFREIETDVLRKLGKGSAQVIATGGGCVTRGINYGPMHQNGKIIWIRRSIEALPTEGRPLSQSNNLQDMYNQRMPLYKAFSDAVIDNDGIPEDALAQILSLLEEA